MFLMAALTRSLASAVAQKDGKGPSTDVELRIPDDVCIGGPWRSRIQSIHTVLRVGEARPRHGLFTCKPASVYPSYQSLTMTTRGQCLPRASRLFRICRQCSTTR